MNRAETRLGATSNAWASAGIRTLPPTVSFTAVCSGDGSTEVTVPTGTPATFTSSPGYSPIAEEKYASICSGCGRGQTSWAPAPIIRIRAASTARRILLRRDLFAVAFTVTAA